MNTKSNKNDSLEPENLGSSCDISHEDLHNKFGQSIAFVLAPCKHAEKTLLQTAKTLRSLHVAALFIVADLKCETSATEAMRLLQHKGKNTLIQALALNFETLESSELLSIIKSLATASLDTYQHVLVVDATNAAVDARELYDLKPAEDPSDINVLDKPRLINRRLLENMT